MGRVLTIAWSLLVILALVTPPASLAQTDQRCFPETGFCIEGRLREFWEQNGGLPVFGLPIAAQAQETIEGKPVQAQWFERNRLELHPANARPYDVLLGRLGADRLAQLGVDWRSLPGLGRPLPGCRFFVETGQNVCGEILAAWRASGLEFDGDATGASEAENLALFGLPLTGLTTETIEGKPYQVQWFERARFELHPENQPPFNVLLGLLGKEVRAGATPPVQPTPSPTAAPPPPTPVAEESPYDGVWTVNSSFLRDFRMLVDGGIVRQLSGVIDRGCRVRVEATFTPEQGRINGATFFVRAQTDDYGFALTGTFTSPKEVAGTGEIIFGIAGCRERVGFGWEGRKIAELDREPAPNLDGAWKGSTARGETITFTVKSNAIVDFQVAWNRQEQCVMTLTTPIPIVNRTATIEAQHEIGRVSMFGTFRSDTRIVGEGRFSATSGECRQAGHGFFEWNANKQEE